MKKVILLLIYFVILNNSLFAQETILYPSDVAYGLHFGRTVFAYDDYIMVSAPKGNTAANLGEAVYIFRKNGINWSEEARLTVTDSIIDQCFGCSLAAYENYVLIGAPNDDENGEKAGAAYIFKKEGEEWVKQIKLMPSDPSEFQNFGSYVSLYNDYALISATSDNINGQFNSGSAYVFKRNGDQWLQDAKLVPSDPTTFASFGIRISIYGDYAFIGASSAYNDENIKTGAVYVFKKTGNDWIEQAKLIPSDGIKDDAFSEVIAISDTSLFVGSFKAPGNNEYPKGAGYIFTREGEDWIEQHKLVPNNSLEEDQYLLSSGFSENYIVLANTMNSHSGTAYLFHKKNNEWSQVDVLLPSNGHQHDRFGWTSFLLDNTLIIGAWKNLYKDSDSIETGAVYVYDLDLLVADKDVESLETSIQIFPNPSSQSLTVTLNSTTPLNIENFEVYNMSGQRVQIHTENKSSQNAFEWQLNTATFASGIYVIKISTDNGFYHSRFVKL